MVFILVVAHLECILKGERMDNIIDEMEQGVETNNIRVWVLVDNMIANALRHLLGLSLYIHRNKVEVINN